MSVKAQLAALTQPSAAAIQAAPDPARPTQAKAPFELVEGKVAAV